MKKLDVLTLLILTVLGSGCSHGKSEQLPEVAPSEAGILDTPMPESTEILSLPKGSSTSINDYLNQVALPKIVNANVVHECFLDNPKAKSKELRTGRLSFRFEIKLTAEGKQVVPENVYLSSFSNVPEWTKPCMIKGYQKLKLPPFYDSSVKTTSAFGTINMSWTPKRK
jgi:hypothetical protein